MLVLLDTAEIKSREAIFDKLFAIYGDSMGDTSENHLIFKCRSKAILGIFLNLFYVLCPKLYFMLDAVRIFRLSSSHDTFLVQLLRVIKMMC